MAAISAVVIYRSITKNKISRTNANRKLTEELREDKADTKTRPKSPMTMMIMSCKTLKLHAERERY
jgi:hypothetical protein